MWILLFRYRSKTQSRESSPNKLGTFQLSQINEDFIHCKQEKQKEEKKTVTKFPTPSFCSLKSRKSRLHFPPTHRPKLHSHTHTRIIDQRTRGSVSGERACAHLHGSRWAGRQLVFQLWPDSAQQASVPIKEHSRASPQQQTRRHPHRPQLKALTHGDAGGRREAPCSTCAWFTYL